MTRLKVKNSAAPTLRLQVEPAKGFAEFWNLLPLPGRVCKDQREKALNPVGSWSIPSLGGKAWMVHGAFHCWPALRVTVSANQTQPLSDQGLVVTCLALTRGHCFKGDSHLGVKWSWQVGFTSQSDHSQWRVCRQNPRTRLGRVQARPFGSMHASGTRSDKDAPTGFP